MEGLKSLLESRPDRKKVYFNEAGEYLFHESKGFDTVKTREEILGDSGSAEETNESKSSKKSSKK